MHTLGQLFILAALAMNIVTGVSYFMQARGRRGAASLANKSYNLLTMFVTLSVIGLFYLFFSHDYSFKYVYEYSQHSQPFFYILSAFWGGQEGTYLLWLFFSVLFGYLLRRYAGIYREWAMALYCLVNLFLLLVLTKLSPFALLPFAAPDGAGLNPLLRDPWMVIHPPLMFIGYAMAALPFVLALAALIKGEYTHWLKIAFPWAAITSVMLAAGNILGGFWAYKTLGWGGYWGWDPVENSSFVPWMISLALLHGMIIERRTGAFRRINILLSAFLFLLVVYGTFLTRSGVLSDFSVHSFVDLGVNVYLVGFMGLFFALTVILFAVRMSTVKTVPLSYNVYGREFSLFGGLALLFVTGVIVLFWSSLPVITSIIGIEPRAAEVETYNKFALPLAILFSLLLTYAPFSSFSERIKPPSMGLVAAAFVVSALAGFGVFHLYLGTEITFAVVFALVAGSVIMFALKPGALRSLAPALGALVITVILCAAYGVQNYLYVLFFVTASMGLVSNLIAFAALLPGRIKISGAQVTHIGFTIMLIGILASSAYSEETKIQIDRGRTATAFSRSIGYEGMENDIEHPNNKLHVTVDSEKEAPTLLTPELYYSRRMDGLFKKPAIERSLLHDLYLAPAQVIELQSGDGLVLSRGEVARVADLRVSFLGFDMGSHGSESNTLRAATIIEVISGNRVDTIAPAVIQGIGPDGESQLTNEPAALVLPNGDTVAVSLRGIQADQGQVIIDIPGITQSGPPDRLILDVALKPLINLVWGGAILILLGTCIVFYRRLSEIGNTSSGTV